jgi:hypothetical protein
MGGSPKVPHRDRGPHIKDILARQMIRRVASA